MTGGKRLSMLLAPFVAATMLIAAPAQAVPIGAGSQIDIVGVVDVQASDFQPGGLLDFEGDGTVNIATGDFAGLMGSAATLFDLSFTVPETVWSVGGFSFTANNFFEFDNVIPGRGFEATGTITGGGFDPTPGIMSLSTQSTGPNQVMASFSSSTIAIPLPAPILLFISAIGGLGFLGWRRQGATA